jgi:dihydroneopterin aldolase
MAALPSITAPLAGAQQVFIEGLRVQARIGVFEHEKAGTQPLAVDLELQVDAARFRPLHDRLDEVFDYQGARTAVLEVAGSGHIHLLETFADRVLTRLLAMPDVLSARIRIRKFTAFTDCAAVGVVVERNRTP